MLSVGLSRLDVDSYYNFEGVDNAKLALAKEFLEIGTLALTELELELLRREEGLVSEKSKQLVNDDHLASMTTAELNKVCGDCGWDRAFASGDRNVGESFKWELKRRREWLRREKEERERRQKYLLRFGNVIAKVCSKVQLAQVWGDQEGEQAARQLDQLDAGEDQGGGGGGEEEDERAQGQNDCKVNGQG